MKTSEEQGFDNLKDYISQEHIEKAPDGFTERVMTAVRLDPFPSARRKEKVRSILVPAAFGIFFIALAVIAMLTGNSEKSQIAVAVEKFFENISLSFPAKSLLTSNSIPGALVYIPAGIFALVILDSIIMRRRNKRAIIR